MELKVIPKIRDFKKYCPREHHRYRSPLKGVDGTKVFAGILIVHCEKCNVLYPQKVDKSAPNPSSIIEYTPYIRRNIPKSLIRNKQPGVELTDTWWIADKMNPRRLTSLISDVQEEVQRKVGKSVRYDTLKKVLNFCSEAGKKIALTVDGVVRRIREDGRESFVRIPDPHGIDPPLIGRKFSCETCGADFDVTDIAWEESFHCFWCGTQYKYGNVGDVENQGGLPHPISLGGGFLYTFPVIGFGFLINKLSDFPYRNNLMRKRGRVRE